MPQFWYLSLIPLGDTCHRGHSGLVRNASKLWEFNLEANYGVISLHVLFGGMDHAAWLMDVLPLLLLPVSRALRLQGALRTGYMGRSVLGSPESLLGSNCGR